MTLVAYALLMLFMGAAASLLAVRTPILGLRIGLVAIMLSGAMSLVASWGALHQGIVSHQAMEWLLPLGHVQFALDGLSAWFLAIIGLVSVATSIYTWSYFGDEAVHDSVGFYGALVCLMTAAMILVVSAADVVIFLLGWELMSLSAFFLVGFHDDDSESRRGAWTYLIATHLGTALGVLPVFAMFVARTGQTSMSGFAGAFDASQVASCTAIFALGVVGFGTKAGFMPFHVWLPLAHPVAPSPVSALMSGVVIKTGIYGLLRLLTWLPELPARCAVSLMIVSLVTGVMGILYALGQSRIKSMLAYSSVENIGIIGLAVSLAVLGRTLGQPAMISLGLAGALLHVLNHALFKSLLFLSAGAVVHDTGTGDMERLGGLARESSVNAMAFLVGSVAICALPPLNGFVSEFTIYLGILQGVVTTPGRHAMMLVCSAAALALIGGLALVVFSKTFAVIFLGSRRDQSITTHQTPRSMKAGMMTLAAACAVLGVGWTLLLPLLGEAIKPFGAWSPQLAEQLLQSLGRFPNYLAPVAILIVIAVGLLAVRRRLGNGTIPGGALTTWGCGYASPRATMQYTGSSFGWTMMDSFRLFIRPARRKASVAGSFPSPSRLATSCSDLAFERIYKPIFGCLARLFERLWPLQDGRIQLYLVYIVATVLIVFAMESWSQRRPGGQNEVVPTYDSRSLAISDSLHDGGTKP